MPFDYYSSGVTCGQCQVVVSDPYFDKTNTKPKMEQRALDRATMGMHENSRLACCVQIRPELNEMICVVANNKSADGEWFGGRDPNAF